MLRKILSFAGISLLVYLLIALTLTFMPVATLPATPDEPRDGLDFSVLDTAIIDETGFEERAFSARDGDKLFFRYLAGDKDILLVLLHGSGSEGRYLKGLAQTLNRDYGATVVLPDLRGHGRSTLSMPGDVAYLGQYLDDMEDLHATLKLLHPKAKMVLGGHSSGGGLALKYGGSNKPPYDGYLLLAPYLSYKAATTRPNSGGWVQVAKRRYAGLSMLNRLGISRFNHMPVLFFNRPEGVQDALQLDSYSYRLNESFAPQDYRGDLQANSSPMLLLVGAEDEAFYADQFQPLVTQYAPHARVEIIPGVKHLALPNSFRTGELAGQWLLSSVYTSQ